MSYIFMSSWAPYGHSIKKIILDYLGFGQIHQRSPSHGPGSTDISGQVFAIAKKRKSQP